MAVVLVLAPLHMALASTTMDRAEQSPSYHAGNPQGGQMGMGCEQKIQPGSDSACRGNSQCCVAVMLSIQDIAILPLRLFTSSLRPFTMGAVNPLPARSIAALPAGYRARVCAAGKCADAVPALPAQQGCNVFARLELLHRREDVASERASVASPSDERGFDHKDGRDGYSRR